MLPCTDHTENTALLLLRTCMLRPLHSNDRCLQSRLLATGLHATIIFVYVVLKLAVLVSKRYNLILQFSVSSSSSF
jgi:hypothetical protein